ncbi:response regulator [Lacibacterium aquatile]|uniref:Response regulator n=1 Tax=Lacibacterium aquatile TaxID=1168082 RepID=A0ABW5DU54_9PROT
MRILIVEDEMITAMHLEDLAIELGHTVVGTAQTASAAVSAADSFRPDLVLIDLRLAHGTDGVEAAMEIRRRQNIPSIFISGKLDDASRKRAAPARPLGYITKPFTREDLALALAEAQSQI